MRAIRSANETIRRVFIVDDYPLIREFLTTLIRQQPDMAVCGQAASAPEAIEGVIASRPDAVVVELSLNGELALTLIKELCELEPAPAVLVLTANDESFYAERVLRAGALGYVMKREATGKVVDALRHVLDGKIYASPPILIRLAEKFITAPNAPETSPIASLTDRELEIFELMGRGYETDRIAAELQLSAKTVQFYYVRIREKFGLPNFTALLCEAARWRAQNYKN